MDELERELDAEANPKMVCETSSEFARMMGVSEKTVSTWKSRGMPHKPGNPSPIVLSEALPWLRANGFLGAANRHPERSTEQGPAEDSTANDLFTEMDAAINARSWSRAIQLMLIEIDLYAGEPAHLGDILLEFEDTIRFQNEIDDGISCDGGTVALRIRRTRVYLWAELQRDFADAFVGLFNAGILYAVPAEPGRLPHVDLPAVEDLDLGKPPTSNCRIDLEFSANPEGALSLQLEAVAKPNLILCDE